MCVGHLVPRIKLFEINVFKCVVRGSDLVQISLFVQRMRTFFVVFYL